MIVSCSRLLGYDFLIVLGYIFVCSLLYCVLLTLLRYHKDQNNVTNILSCLIKICYVLMFFFLGTIIVWYFKPLKLINVLVVTWCSLPTLVSSLYPCFLNFGPHTHNFTSLFVQWTSTPH